MWDVSTSYSDYYESKARTPRIHRVPRRTAPTVIISPEIPR